MCKLLLTFHLSPKMDSQAELAAHLGAKHPALEQSMEVREEDEAWPSDEPGESEARAGEYM